MEWQASFDSGQEWGCHLYISPQGNRIGKPCVCVGGDFGAASLSRVDS